MAGEWEDVDEWEDVPEGMTQAQADAFMADVKIPPQLITKEDPTIGMSFGDKFASGMGKAAVDAGRGVKQLGLQGLSATIDNPIASPVINEWLNNTNQDIEQSKERDAPLMESGAAQAGNMVGAVGTYAPLAAVPGANSIAGSSVLGGLFGATQPANTMQERGINTATGTAAGFGGGILARSVSRVLNPQTSPEVTRLMDRGVTPTPGQILQGAPRKLEQGISSVPILGDIIKNGERRATEQFNVAVINDVLEPLGVTMPRGVTIGREMIDDVSNVVNNAYDDVLRNVTVQMDSTATSSLARIRDRSISDLPPELQRTFDNIITNRIINKIPPNQRISGNTFKEIETDLNNITSKYSASSGSEGRLGQALEDVLGEMRSLLSRSNPARAQELANVNSSFARLTRAQKASSSMGAEDGVFSPAQLKNAVKAGDKSARKNQFSRGGALMQEIAEDGQSVLGKNVPDSGTPYRALSALMMGGYFEPTLAATVGVGMLPYTGIGQRTAASLLTQRPDIIRRIGTGANMLTPYAGILSSDLAN